jgi:hypothetical protein
MHGITEPVIYPSTSGPALFQIESNRVIDEIAPFLEPKS